LTHRDELTDEVAAEIERLGASTAYLLGGEEALEPQVAAELTAAGLTVERRGGDNRFDTARVLAEEIGGTDVYVTEGFDVDPTRGWPDALAIAPLAAKQERPILLVDTNGVPQETAEAIEALDVANATVVGGEVAVSGQTEEDIRALGVNTTRLAGETRFGTSALASVLAEDAGLSFQRLWLARGGDWPDALTSGPTVAADNGILLLVDDADLDNSPQTRDIIEDRGCEVSLLRFLGGTEAISANTENQGRGFLEPCAAS
jgi:putative cell wall-binding protein